MDTDGDFHFQNEDFSMIDIISALPASKGPNYSCAKTPSDLIGAKILAFGTTAAFNKFVGGGLAIDYLPSGAIKPRRIIFAFTEVAMWIQYQSDSE